MLSEVAFRISEREGEAEGEESCDRGGEVWGVRGRTENVKGCCTLSASSQTKHEASVVAKDACGTCCDKHASDP